MWRLFFWALLVLFAVPAKADSCDRRDRRIHIRAILVRLFPYNERARSIRLFVECDSRPGAAYTGGRLVVHSGLFAFRDDKIAAILAHEMGHAELDQDPPDGLFGEDLAQLEKNEIEADDFSLAALRRAGYGRCAAYRAMAKTLRFYSVIKNPAGPRNRIVVHRLGRLQETCVVH